MGHRLRSPVRATTIRVDSQGRCCNLREFHCCMIKMRRGTDCVQANWQVTVEGKSSVHKLAGVFPSQTASMQEGGTVSSTDVAEPVTDSTEVDRTSKESVSFEQGQLLRAAEPAQCVLRVKTQRQRDTVEFTHSLLGVNGKAADDLHRRRKDSDLEDASFDRTGIAAEAGMDKILVNHNNGAVAIRMMSLCTRSESVAIGWTSGDLVCAVSNVKKRQQRLHC